MTVIDHSREYFRQAENAVERAVARGGIRIQKEATQLINRFSSPPPSIEGEPPHKDTGRLGRSIETETFERARVFTARTGTNVRYGRWLETGTSRMGARPYLRPALDTTRPAFLDDLRRQMRRVKT